MFRLTKNQATLAVARKDYKLHIRDGPVTYAVLKYSNSERISRTMRVLSYQEAKEGVSRYVEEPKPLAIGDEVRRYKLLGPLHDSLAFICVAGELAF